MSETLHFKVSSGLKNIIGRELINDKYIAIFELVKNSYDAGANKVSIIFDNIRSQNATITIKDDGSGMSKDDIINKWLFVAYSEKKNPSYRDKIKRSVAGAKGVGRFSCDRLGKSVRIETKKRTEEIRHVISIEWSDFEKDSLDNFSDINVDYSFQKDSTSMSGTSIIISNLRETWSRADLLQLKKSLTQMVNPSATKQYDPFEILLYADDEKQEDKKEKEERNKVNGGIRNNVFQTLNEKTIQIKVRIAEDGKTISTELYDRGIYIFKTIEKNEFSLKDISCELYFLNRIAKLNFTRIMGVEAINYGSIFVYKNSFRIYPYGEPGQDFFDIDQRKQQGYKRFLGTRELIGQIEINGDDNDLIETSSRNNGFIKSPHLEELRLLFIDYVLKPLEKYVVNIVQWGDTESFIDSAKKVDAFGNIPAIIKMVKSKTKNEAYISIDYNHDIEEILLQYKSKSSEVIKELKDLAQATENQEILKKAEEVEKHTQKLVERVHEANQEALNSREELEQAQVQLDLTKKQALTLDARANLTAKDAIDAMHIMKGYADAIDSYIDEVYDVANDMTIDISPLRPLLDCIAQVCSKIMNSYNLVIQTEYSAGTDLSHDDIVTFLGNYVSIIQQPISIEIRNLRKTNNAVRFNPLEMSIIIDNIISNSKKANAQTLTFTFEDCDYGLLIRCKDDGYGLKQSADSNRIFEPGYSPTGGTGIGMSTIQKYITKIGGKAEYNPEYKTGFELLLYLRLWI